MTKEITPEVVKSTKKEGITISPFTGMPCKRQFKSWLSRWGFSGKYALYKLTNPFTDETIGNEEFTEYVDLNSYKEGKPMHYLISDIREEASEVKLSAKEIAEIEVEIEEREHAQKKIQQEIDERRKYLKNKNV